MMHHANILIGDVDWAWSIIPNDDRELSQDVLFLSYTRMGISDARTLMHEAQMRPTHRSYRVFIISCTSILHEAQNALLKLFEEPNSHTIFYFIIPRADSILPTLASRLHTLGIQNYGDVQEKVNDAFLESAYGERLALIAQKLEVEDVAWQQILIQNLALYAHTSKNPEVIREVLFLESYIHAPGSSKKMLFEHIALALPERIKG